MENADAVYIASAPELHEEQVEAALHAGKHVLCETPIALSVAAYDRLCALADGAGLVLMDAMKPAYATAYHRLKLLVKSGRIGDVVAVDATCTTLRDDLPHAGPEGAWNTMCSWGPTAMLPVFQLLGTNFDDAVMSSMLIDGNPTFDLFSKIDFYYPHAVATVKIGKGAKSEGELVVSGTKGYLYVPAPWWKTDYYEIRYENPADNRRFFYQLNGEGIRFELVRFARAIADGALSQMYFDRTCARAMVGVVEKFYRGDIDHVLHAGDFGKAAATGSVMA